MNKLRYKVVYEVDKELLCDQETLDQEFNGSWQECLDWCSKEELGEVITGFGELAIAIQVEDTTTPENKSISKDS